MAMVGCFISCSDQQTYLQAIAGARSNISYVSEFVELYPGCNVSISHYTSKSTKPKVFAEAPIYDRYIRELELTVHLNRSRSKVVSYEAPIFRLLEVTSVESIDDVRVSIKYGRHQYQFGAEEWQKIVSAKDDLSVLNESIQKNNPIPGFRRHWQEM